MEIFRPGDEKRPTQLEIEANGKIEQAIAEISGEKRIYRPTEKLTPVQKSQVRDLDALYRHLINSANTKYDDEELSDTDAAAIISRNDQFRTNYHQLDEEGNIEFVGLEASDFSVDDHFFAFEQIQNGFSFDNITDPTGLHASNVFKMPDGKQLIWKMFYSKSLRTYVPQDTDQILSPETKRHIWVFTRNDLKEFLEFHSTIFRHKK